MSEDSQQMGLDEVIEQNDKSDVSVDLHPHIRQLGIELPDGWQAVSLGEIGQLDTSSVDKKSNSDERRIHLVNYMDVYEKHRINCDIVYMEVTAHLQKNPETSEIRRLLLKKWSARYTVITRFGFALHLIVSSWILDSPAGLPMLPMLRSNLRCVLQVLPDTH